MIDYSKGISFKNKNNDFRKLNYNTKTKQPFFYKRDRWYSCRSNDELN